MSGITYPSGPQTLAIPTTILLPSAATPFNPSTVNPSVEACWDAIKAEEYYGFFKTTFDAAQPPYPAGGSFVNSGTYKLAGAISFTSAASDSLVHSSAHAYARSARPFAQFDSTEWTSFFINSGDPQYQTPVKTSTIPLVFEFDLPDGITLEQVTLRVEPDNGHVALPNVMPRFDVYMADNSTGNKTLLATGTDASATFGDYNAPHTISATIASVAFGAWKNSLYVRVYGESGVDAINNFIACVPIVEFNRTRIALEFGELLP
jgi:hypothetical protein